MTQWDARAHAASRTDEYLFHQLIPYIGNKRKLLGLITSAMKAAEITPRKHAFLDLFAGTGVVSRMAKQKGFAVIANDWEPYSEILNRCAIESDESPLFFGHTPYAEIIERLNALPPHEGWVTRHLCPRNDENFDIAKDRLFYMRKNGLRIDAIREQIETWDREGNLTPPQKATLLAPLLYQACYNANTSGVFKGFHNGWGGQTGTALYRIKDDLRLRPALFHQGEHPCQVTRMDAQALAESLDNKTRAHTFAYLDPPYNQHPYGANYHVLNSIALWDKPELTPQITGHGTKSAIRTDWRTDRRSAYNYASEAAAAYEKLLQTLATPWIATSYSTDGTIPIRKMIEINHALGDVQILAQPYKRYRVSSQRFSPRPMTTELILLTRVGASPSQSIEALMETLKAAE